jgi:hypothetical protein
MEILIDRETLDEVEATVTSDKFTQFLLSNTTEFGTCAFILQTILDAVKDARETLDSDEE